MLMGKPRLSRGIMSAPFENIALTCLTIFSSLPEVIWPYCVPSVAVGYGKLRIEAECRVMVCYCLLVVAKGILGVPSVEVGFAEIWVQFQGGIVVRNGLFVVTSMFFLIFRFISFRRRSKTPEKFRVSALVDSLIFDEAVQVVIDGFGRYAVVFPQMVQDGLFEGFRGR